MILNISLDEGLELDDSSESSEDSGDDTTEELRPCLDPLCGWSRRKGWVFFIEIKRNNKISQNPFNLFVRDQVVDALLCYLLGLYGKRAPICNSHF